MIIDLTNLITNRSDSIDVNINIDDDILNNSPIRKLVDTKFVGSIYKLYSGDYKIEGILSGVMTLPDDITLEDVNVKFNTDICEEFSEIDNKNDNNLKIVNNTLDIQEFLWQNILVEIPLKVTLPKNEDLSLKGNGWRLITEDELKSDNSPFSELLNKFKD